METAPLANRDFPHLMHIDDLGMDCGECHSSEDFAISEFDHGKTRFPLEGAHQNASCEGCQLAETGASGGLMVRYRPIETDCSSCHGGAT